VVHLVFLYKPETRDLPEREERLLTAEDPKAAISKPFVHAGQRDSTEEAAVVSGGCMVVACVKHAGHMALPID